MLSLYIIAILTITYSVFTYGTYFHDLITYLTTQPSINNPNIVRTAALEKLVVAPTFGQFFYQELIADYVLQNQWQKVLNSSLDALQSPINKNSYEIWYYKATAECFLSHAQQCERSARIANSLSPDGHENNIQQLFKLAKIIKNQKVKLIKNKDEVLVFIDPSKVLEKEVKQNEEIQYIQQRVELRNKPEGEQGTSQQNIQSKLKEKEREKKHIEVDLTQL